MLLLLYAEIFVDFLIAVHIFSKFDVTVSDLFDLIY